MAILAGTVNRIWAPSVVEFAINAELRLQGASVQHCSVLCNAARGVSDSLNRPRLPDLAEERAQPEPTFDFKLLLDGRLLLPVQ